MTVPDVRLLSRAGTIDQNPQTFLMRAKAWANARPDGSTLVVWRDEDGIHDAVVSPGVPAARDAAVKLAVTVAAHADPGVLGLPPVAQVVAARVPRRVSIETRETVAGADPAETARALALSIGVGEWVAIAARHPAGRERRWWRRWLAGQFNGERTQHHSTREGASVVSVFAGAADRQGADALLHAVFAAMPGFDLPVESWAPSTWGVGSRWIAGSGAAVLVATVAGGSARLSVVSVWFVVLAAVLFVAGVLVGVGRVPSFASRVFAGRFTGLFPVPGASWVRPRPPRRSQVDRDGVVHEAEPGDYPLARQAFMVGSDLVAAVAAPQAGALAGENRTAGRSAPAAVQSDVGPLIGQADDLPVHLSAGDMFAGVIALGSAGTGKSVFVHNVWGWMCLDKVSPAGRPGFPGRGNALVAFESKGDGADHYVRFAQYAGDSVYRVELGDASRPAIDLFPPSLGSVEYRARLAATALKYTFGEDSIQERSFDTLRRVFAAAFVIAEHPEGIVSEVPGLPGLGSAFLYAAALMGERGDDVAVALAGQLQSEAMRLDAGEDTDLGFAAAQITPLFSGLTPSKRSDLFQAPRNKITNLLAAEPWWSRPSRLTWDQVLSRHLTVVVNTGSTRGGVPVDDKLTEEMSGMLMYTLYDAIKRNCSGWQEDGRHVTIFADELKLLAGRNPEIITWLRDQGRSFGVQPVFATQRAEQLDRRVKEAVTGFGTLLAFAQDNPQVARQLADDFAADGSNWVPADVVNLPPYTAIVRTKVAKTRQPAFTCQLASFESASGVSDDYRMVQGH